MTLNLKHLSLSSARLEILTRTKADLQAQFLELIELHEQVRTAQLSADQQNVARARKPALVVIPAAAEHVRLAADGCASGAIGASADSSRRHWMDL